MSEPDLTTKINACRELLAQLVDQYPRISFANSLGAEDMVLSDIILQDFPQITVFTLDTGRLPAETYDLMQQLEERYQTRLHYYYPDAKAIESFTHDNGINAFYNSVELRKQCCQIRKVEPLKRALQGQDAWITGQRRQQSSTRTELEVVEYDANFGLQKANPLADWTEREVWDYIKSHDVPYNKLHDQFYPSIGCAPCTRAITPGEDIRSGRWWWEDPDSKECGLHPAEKNSNY